MTKLERWTIVASPTTKDPKRHSLLVRGDKNALYAIIRKFGALCGRPQKAKEADYNYSLYLHGVTGGQLDKIEQALAVLAPEAERGAAPPPGEMKIERGYDPVMRAPEPPSPPPAFVPPPPKAAAPAPEPAPPKVEPPKGPAEAARLKLDPVMTFDTLQVGHFNRFAHAASMAVISNPGMMYNPLFLYGMPGTGKTHVLMAIGRAIAEQQPQGEVFYTTGPALAVAVKRLTAENKLNDLEALAGKCKALMIDDVHLLSVNAQNKAGLVSFLSHFFKATKHVAMTSIYPPRALAALEDSMNFKISSGWSVEMKLPNAETQHSIVESSFSRMGLVQDKMDIHVFLEGVGSDFQSLGRWLKRVKSMVDLRRELGGQTALRDILPTMFLAGETMSGLQPRTIRREVSCLALIHPEGSEPDARGVLQSVVECGRLNGLELAIGSVAPLAYNPEEFQGFPFLAAEHCEAQGAQVALVAGPPQGSAMTSRETEMAHAIEHLLSGFGIATAWIGAGREKDVRARLHAVLDLSFTI